jgi:abortive infection bacteriophage resistance protein
MFDKKPTTIDEQIKLLKKRGLIISDVNLAKNMLSKISYYRLGEYWFVMQNDKENHKFKPNSHFKNVVELYEFDEEIRLLLFSVISKIEIALRTKLIYHLSHEVDPWWFQNFKLFKSSRELVKTLGGLEQEISRTKDVTIKKHYKSHKDDERFPPAWKSLEQTSFGALSKLYGNLKPCVKSKDTIAKKFGAVNHTYLPSWLQSIAQIRNFCAHHSRLWNRNLPGTVKLLKNPPNPWINKEEKVPKQHEFQKLYIHMTIMKYMLNTIQPNNTFRLQLFNLLKKYANIDENALGMKVNWHEEPVWKS